MGIIFSGLVFYFLLFIFFPKVVAVAREVTGESDNDTAVVKFREKLNSSESYFNAEPIPKNESDKEAHRKCSDIEGAKKYCLKRWAAMQLWFAESRKVIKSAYHLPQLVSRPVNLQRLVPTSNEIGSGVRVGSVRSLTFQCKKKRSRNRNRKRDEIRIGRIRRFLFYSDCAFASVAHYLFTSF